MDSAPPQAASQQPNCNASQPPSATTMPRSQGSASMTHGLMGKHRISSAISLLDQQIHIIQHKLNELETVDGVSTVCQELISSIESAPDSLLPVTKGPAEVGWAGGSKVPKAQETADDGSEQYQKCVLFVVMLLNFYATIHRTNSQEHRIRQRNYKFLLDCKCNTASINKLSQVKANFNSKAELFSLLLYLVLSEICPVCY